MSTFLSGIVRTTAAAALAVIAASASAAETIEAAGGLTFYKEAIEPNAQLIRDRTGLTVKYAGPTTGLGIFLLVQGRAKVAFALDTLEESIKQAHAVAREQGAPITIPSDLVYRQFATDKLGIIVNKQNPVSAISKAQFKDIAAGRTRNWKELGGPDLPIKVITGTPTTATRLVVERQVLDGQAFAAGATEVRTTAEELKRVSTDPGAIGFISRRYADTPGTNVKAISGPPASRPWAAVTIGKPVGDAQKLIDFLLSPEGQKLVQH
ncbi:MAG TPA: substrate-binding domain-containing protein [Usitatibacter sp.]|nr:substrate-binding domain-containing protein [Usitatibacter sp.]